MSKAYRIESDGRTTPMTRIRTKNENKELQQILERNPDLLPGEQIDRKRQSHPMAAIIASASAVNWSACSSVSFLPRCART